MITLQRRERRHHDRKTNHDVWSSFAPGPEGALGALEGLDEIALQPGGILPRRHDEGGEALLLVREGAIAYEDSTGRSGIVQAGEVQHRAEGGRVRHRQSNASRSDAARAVELRFRTSREGRRGVPHGQRRFGNAALRNALCLVASPTARDGSLRVQHDVLVYVAILDDGRHVAHAIEPPRLAFLQVLRGSATVGSLLLVAGDGARFVDERVVSATARGETEILVLDLGPASVVREGEAGPREPRAAPRGAERPRGGAHA